MKSLFPIYIAILTVMIVLFFTRNYQSWSEMSSQKKNMVIGLLTMGVLILCGLIIAFILSDQG